MVYVSLILNIVVLIPICSLLLFRFARAAKVWGEPSPGRSILTALYLTILIGSILFLIVPRPEFIVVLLGFQVVYKILSWPLVGTLRNPVVLANQGIAIVHIVTIATLLPAIL